MAARRGSGTSLNSHHQDTLAESRRDSNVFSDDYAESIAGSFADSEDAVSVGRSASVRSIGIHNIDGAEDPFRDTAARSAGAVMWQGQHHIGQPSRSSTRKSLRGPGAQEVDQSHGLGFGHGTNNGIAPARIATHRTASTASSASYAQPTSPVSLAHGPSHPYGMYPQGISVSRSESVASTTTGRTRSQLYHGRPRPAHPYALYSQNVADPTPDVQQSIPVGFPGQHTNSFHRNIGPEGEEQDIIGPDGHMEQLPPYSRYPEQEHSKLAGATPQPSIVADADQSVPQSDPSIETSDPPDGPEEDDTSESAPLNRQPGDASGFGYGPPSEKSWDEKTWRERKNHRVGCLPLWGFTALMVGLVMCGTIIGAAIGEAVGRHSSTATNSNNSTSTSTMTQTSNYPKEGKTPFGSAPMVTETVTATTTMIDASPIPTISAIPSFSTVLPTGKYAVSFGEASMAGNGCLVNSLQINAWSCQLTPSAVTLLVTPGDKPGRYNASISPFGPTTVYTYGEQPPQVLPQPIKPALDQGIPQNYGLAYQFQTTYEKVVIIDEEALSPSRKNRMKRGGQFWRQVHRGTVNNNDKPWFCHFPNTFIEGFIYVQNDTDPSAASSTTTTTTTSDSSGTETRTITVVPSGSTYMPTSIATSWSGTDNAYPSSMSFIQHQRQSGGPPPPPPPPPPPSPSSPPPPPPPPSWKKRGLERRQSTNNQLSRYPRRVKLIERRLRTVDGAMPGYCVKMQYQGGDWVPICDGNGNQMMIPLAEDDPPAPAPSAPQSPALSRRNFGNNECYCQWLSN